MTNGVSTNLSPVLTSSFARPDTLQYVVPSGTPYRLCPLHRWRRRGLIDEIASPSWWDQFNGSDKEFISKHSHLLLGHFFPVFLNCCSQWGLYRVMTCRLKQPNKNTFDFTLLVINVQSPSRKVESQIGEMPPLLKARLTTECQRESGCLSVSVVCSWNSFTLTGLHHLFHPR